MGYPADGKRRTAGAGRDLRARWPDRVAAALHARRRGGRRARAVRRAAAVLLFLAAGVFALARPPSAGIPALAASRDLPAGATLGASDLVRTALPHPPDGVLDGAVGRVLSGPLRRGEVITDARVVVPAGPDPGVGRAAVPVHPSDPATAALLTPGMHIAVIKVSADGLAATLAADAVVLAVSQPPERPGQIMARIVILSVPVAVADSVAAASTAGTVTFRFA